MMILIYFGESQFGFMNIKTYNSDRIPRQSYGVLGFFTHWIVSFLSLFIPLHIIVLCSLNTNLVIIKLRYVKVNVNLYFNK